LREVQQSCQVCLFVEKKKHIMQNIQPFRHAS
jgi:hypothetical protein